MLGLSLVLLGVGAIAFFGYRVSGRGSVRARDVSGVIVTGHVGRDVGQTAIGNQTAVGTGATIGTRARVDERPREPEPPPQPRPHWTTWVGLALGLVSVVLGVIALLPA